MQRTYHTIRSGPDLAAAPGSGGSRSEPHPPRRRTPMEIQAGGKVWDVETRAENPLGSEGEEFCGVTFRDRGDRDGEVAIGWVPRSGRLTLYAARRLFE